MLVLTRKPNQTIEIGNTIVTILDISREFCRVKLGIQAPDDVKVKRGEIEGEYMRRG